MVNPLFEVIPLCRSARRHRPPGVRAVPYSSRCTVSKSPRSEKREKRMIRPMARIVRFSLSGLLFADETVYRLRCCAGPACLRWSGRYCVSLVLLEPPLPECPKAPPARREGSSVQFSMHCIKKPAKRKKRETNDSPNGANRSFLFERAFVYG